MDPLTDASGFPYSPSFDGGLGRCTGAVLCGHQHLPFRVGGRHAQVPCVCVCACPSWPGRWAGLPGALSCASPFPVAVLGALFVCSAPSGLGLPCLWLFLRFFSFVRPPCLSRSVFSGPGCLGPWRLVVPPPRLFFFPFFIPPPFFSTCLFFSPFLGFFFLFFPLPFFFFAVPWCAGCVVVGWCVLGCGVCWCVMLWACCFGGGRCVIAICRSVLPGCASSFCVVACCVARAWWRRAGGVALCRAASGGCLVVLPAPYPSGALRGLFSFFLLVGCVLVVLPPLPPPAGCVALCCGLSCVVLCGAAICGVFCVVPGVVWRACVELGSCAMLFGAVLCGVSLCCFCCALMSCAAAFSAVFFFLVPCPSVVLRAVSVSSPCLCGAVLVCLRRCSLCGALLPLRRWLVFCVVACCVCLFAVGPGCPLLSPGGSWWLPVSFFGDVLWCVSGCCAAPCCCALCRLALCCCALCCFVLLCLVLWRAVSCRWALSVVLGSCAFRRCVLPCRPAPCVFCCGVLLCAVVRRCALCPVRLGVSFCVFPVLSALCGVAVRPCSPSVPCSPVLCPVVLCCRVVLWCPVLLPCLVCFLCLFGFSYLKNRCKIC